MGRGDGGIPHALRRRAVTALVAGVVANIAAVVVAGVVAIVVGGVVAVVVVAGVVGRNDLELTSAANTTSAARLLLAQADINDELEVHKHDSSFGMAERGDGSITH